MKKTATYRLTESSDRWLIEQSKKRGISKNDVVQELINKEMEKEKTGTGFKPAAEKSDSA